MHAVAPLLEYEPAGQLEHCPPLLSSQYVPAEQEHAARATETQARSSRTRWETRSRMLEVKG